MRLTTKKGRPDRPVDSDSAPGSLDGHTTAGATSGLPERRSSFLVQFRRYMVVGGTAWIVDVSTLLLLTEVVGAHYVLSATIGFTLGLLLNYALSISWVFDRRALSNRRVEFGIFAMIGTGGVGLNAFIVWSLTEYVLPHYLLAKVVSTGFVLWWNFLAKKYILFR